MSDGSGGVRGLMNLTPEAHIFISFFLLSACLLVKRARVRLAKMLHSPYFRVAVQGTGVCDSQAPQRIRARSMVWRRPLRLGRTCGCRAVLEKVVGC
jgi:hypothetical protein